MKRLIRRFAIVSIGIITTTRYTHKMTNPEHIKTQLTEYQTLNIYKWTPQNPPKAIVLIVHGMMEHAKRYHEMAGYLNDVDIAVFSLDLPGHGQTGIDTSLPGHLPKTGWQWMCESILQTLTFSHRIYPHLPMFLLGHSMGSYLAQTVTKVAGNSLSGLILSGTSYESPIKTKWANRFLQLLNYWTHEVEELPRIHNLIFKKLNKSVNKAQSDYDWLTQDRTIVTTYENDALCGIPCTLGFYRELTLGLYGLYTPKGFEQLRPYNTLPILFQYGSNDALSQNGKTIQTLIKKYQALGFQNITQYSYPNARHEIYNEIDRNTILHNLCTWIYKHI